jgi:hypothetical protein
MDTFLFWIHPSMPDGMHSLYTAPLAATSKARFSQWFFEGTNTDAVGPHAKPVHTAPWWKVMCLTGVDYFSTLAYQPGIAFAAAGLLSPLATLVLVVLTLLGALPMYYRVAEASPHGQGSIMMLESLFPRWKGKAVVLILLGFAATSFVITITLSAADATAHLIENPLAPHWMHHPVLVTLALLLVLGAVFMRGFSEVIGMAVGIVAIYLVLNAVVVVTGIRLIWAHPDLLSNWRSMLSVQYGNPMLMLGAALLVFPKLALGMSGFETGVAVMPLVKGDPGDTEEQPLGRIRNTKKLLLSAALIMSVLLMLSSVITTVLIPAEALVPGGPAAGRALAFLAHQHLGSVFGTIYDVSTVAMLWFAGASALAGLLNLVPRYLPRYGMAPEWARANRPLIVIFTLITFVVTIAFNADVEAQGGAYATGVLVLIGSGAIAVAIMKWQQRHHYIRYGIIAAIFLYTTIVNMAERPEGLKIASIFIATIICTSLISRVLRSTELRVRGVMPDEAAAKYIAAAARFGPIRIIANRPDKGDRAEYENKLSEARDSHHLGPNQPVLFVEIRPGDASEFSEVLKVEGLEVDEFKILRCQSPAIPNAIAALLLHLRDTTKVIPHAYFGWTEGNPIAYLLKFLVFGEGDTAPVTREVLRQAEDDPLLRPRIHVG